MNLSRTWRTGGAAAILAMLTALSVAAPAAADTVTTLPGNPLTVHVGQRGQLQAFRAGDSTGVFFAPAVTTGDAGFFLAFPAGAPPALTGTVYGFSGSAGPQGLEDYTPLAQAPTTGSGTAADPFRQVTTYAVKPGATNQAEVTQTTTYVNGAQQFGLRWDVRNVSGVPLRFKALVAADFYFDGSDRGTGIFTSGPPRFIGGTNSDTGNSGGFSEVTGGSSPSPPWSAYQALAFGFGPNEVWGKIQSSADSPNATFDNSVSGESVDNSGGIEWDQFAITPVPAGETRSFELIARNAVPSALQLTPTNAGAPRGVPVNITATAKNTEGVPFAGRTLRFGIIGANPGSGSRVLGGDGTATITDPGANAGPDTIVAFVDFNNDGTRQPVEPQASALATFVDGIAPSCKVKVSGDRPGGGGAGKPLVIRVSCGESATVTVAATLRGTGPGAARAAKKRRAVTIKLRRKTRTVAPGAAVPVKLKVPRAVARKYAGKRFKATITVTARDTSGNVKRVRAAKRIKLAKARKGRR